MSNNIYIIYMYASTIRYWMFKKYWIILCQILLEQTEISWLFRLFFRRLICGPMLPMRNTIGRHEAEAGRICLFLLHQCGNVLRYKASYRIFNLESVKHRFSLQCRWYAHVDCGFLSLSWNSISTACTAAQLKNPAHVDVAVASSPRLHTLLRCISRSPKSMRPNPMEGASHVSPGFPLLELKQLRKNWTKDEKMSRSVDLAVFGVGPWDVVQNSVETCWCLIFSMPRDW